MFLWMTRRSCNPLWSRRGSWKLPSIPALILQDIKLASYIGPVQLTIVAVCAAAVIAVSVLLASISIMRKKPKDILTDLS